MKANFQDLGYSSSPSGCGVASAAACSRFANSTGPPAEAVFSLSWWCSSAGMVVSAGSCFSLTEGGRLEVREGESIVRLRSESEAAMVKGRKQKERLYVLDDGRIKVEKLAAAPEARS